MKISLLPSAATWPRRMLGCCLVFLMTLCSGIDLMAANTDNFFSYQGIWYTKLKEEGTCMTRMYLQRDDYSPNRVKISGNPAAEGDIVIPSVVYDGDGKAYTVTEIGAGSFATSEGLPEYSGRRITSITIPSTVTRIGNQAFENQNRLTVIEGCSSVTEIGPSAFRWAYGISDISMFKNVETIGYEAFNACKSLKNVCLPPTLNKIGDKAFYGCENFNMVIFQSNPTAGKDVFGSNTIEKAAVPKGNTILGNPSYASFPVKMFIEYPDDAVVSDWWIYDSGKTKLYFAPTWYTGATLLPGSLKEICKGAFAFCTDLTEVSLPTDVETIGESSFLGCNTLSRAYLNDGLKEIGSSAFQDCVALQEVSLPAGLQSIGADAFRSCSSLENLSIPEDIATIGNNAFCDAGLISVIIPAKASLGEGLFWGCKNLVDVVFPENFTVIPPYSFNGCSALKVIALPSSLREIGMRAFSNCAGLRQVIIGPEVTVFGKDVFSGCTSLVKVAVPDDLYVGVDSSVLRLSYPKDSVIEDDCIYSPDKSTLYFLSVLTEGEYAVPSHVTTIAPQAGYGCDAITGLLVHDNVEVLGKEAFAGCDALSEVLMQAKEKSVIFDNGVFKDCVALEKVSAPDMRSWLGYEFIDEASNPLSLCGHLYFSGVGEVTDIVIPSDIEYIGAYHFVGGRQFKSVTFPDNLRGIGSGCFKDCVALETLDFPNTLSYISGSCFEGCENLTSVSFGESLGSISDKAFYGCPRLSELTVLMPVPYTGADAFGGANYASRYVTALPEYVLDYALVEPWSGMMLQCTEGRVGFENISGLRYFYNTAAKTAAVVKSDYSSLANVEIPARINQFGVFCNVIKIAPSAFSNSSSLRTLSIGRNLEAIPDYSFVGCSNLESVAFNENSVVKTVGNYAFNNCSALKECLLPLSVSEIGTGAFKGCASLENVFIGNQVRYIYRETFMDCSSLKDLTIGGAVTSIAENAFKGCASLTSLMLPPTLQYIGSSAFACENGKLRDLKLGFALNSISDRAFEGHEALSDIYITRPEPPYAYANTFSNYKATLHVVPGTVDVYAEKAPCWFNFYDNGNVKEMIPVSEVEISETSIESPKPGDTIQLTVTVSPANATMTEIYWVSTNPNVATVTMDGLVTIQEAFAAPRAVVAYSGYGDEWDEPDDSYCEILAYSMFGNVKAAACTIGTPDAVDEIAVGEVSETIDYSLPYDVYTLQGTLVGNSLDHLSKGLYIVRQGRLARKVLLNR